VKWEDELECRGGEEAQHHRHASKSSRERDLVRPLSISTDNAVSEKEYAEEKGRLGLTDTTTTFNARRRSTTRGKKNLTQVKSLK